ncbi:MAG TPA: choice-of-anchor Q domain-containing protein [Candidatus Hydrogenedentes bacterium]|nr:choice-of-anchor Q domain-containing protein [Candidatus Hydrogenedentota bacterium]
MYRAETENGPYHYVDSVTHTSGEITYTDTTCAPGTTYYYKLRMRYAWPANTPPYYETTAESAPSAAISTPALYYANKARPDDSGDGLSWAAAKKTIQAAIDAAHAVGGGNVWVAQGRYDEERLGDASGSLAMKEGVNLYGGFVGNETSRNQRNWTLHECVIDGANGRGSGLRAYHVVRGAEDAALDGFTITGGEAIGEGENLYGGGMYNAECSPEVSNCRFEFNAAAEWGSGTGGGGMCNFHASPGVVNCVFLGNFSKSWGGGIRNVSASTPTITNGTFSSNGAEFDGAIYCGGAVSSDESSTCVVRNCVLWDNVADAISGPAAVSYSNVQGGYPGAGNTDVDPLFRGTFDLRLQPNSPCIDSGTAAGAPEADILGNARPLGSGVDMGAYEDAGLVADFSADITSGTAPLTVQFTDLSTTSGAPITGWLWDFGDGTTSTAQNPTHTYTASGFHLYKVSLSVTNADGADCKVVEDCVRTGRIHVDKANISGVEDGLTWGTAFTTIQAAIDIAAGHGGAEVWVADGVYDELRDNDTGSVVMRPHVHLYGGFSGTETAFSARDWSANVAIIEGSTSRAGANAYHVVIAADATLDGFTVSGGYAEGSGSQGSGGGMQIEWASPTLRNCTFAGNIADASGAMNIAYGGPTMQGCNFVENKAAYNTGVGIAFAAAEISLCRFERNAGIKTWDGYGGGLFVTYARAVVSECQFVGNSVGWMYGGGICNYGEGNIRVVNCEFSANSSVFHGGAIYNGGASRAVVQDSLFRANTAVGGDALGAAYGGAICNEVHSDIEVAGCAFIANRAGIEFGGGSGGIYNRTYDGDTSHATVVNCLFAGNWAAWGGGGMDADGATVTNCTFTGNSGYYGGLDVVRSGGGDSTAVVTNCVVWGNSGTGGQIESNATASVTYSDVQGGYPGTGNIDLDPLFVSDGPAAISGTWTAAPVYDAVNDQTTLTDGTAAWTPDALAVHAINADTSQTLMAAVAANTATEIVVWGDVTAYVANGDTYRIIDCHLQSGSPVIDAGAATGAASADIEGTPRPLDMPGIGADGTGTEYDMGAYEAALVPVAYGIRRLGTSPTNAGLAYYSVHFSCAVTGVDVTDFTLVATGLTGASIVEVSGTGALYTLVVDTGTGDGTLRINLIDDDTIVDGELTPLGGVGAGNGSYSVGEVYTLDRTVPTGTLTINAGDQYSNEANVSLALTGDDAGGSGVSQMCFSNDGSTWSAWESVAGTKDWTLSAGDGAKTVYALLKDAVGNVSAPALSDAIVLDSTAPSITECAADAMAPLGLGCLAEVPSMTDGVTATDANGIASVTQAPLAGVVIAENTLVVLTVTDTAGNTAQCEALVSVEDTTPPEITQCASNPGPLSLDSNCEVALPDLTGDVVATDNCGTPVITQAPVAGTMISANTLVTLTATDDEGLTDTCEITVTVQDTTPPEITQCASNPGPLSLDSSCEVALPDLTGEVVATDNCGTPVITQAPVAGTMISANTLVTLTATDDEGLTDTCEVTVTVQDTTPPEITQCASNPGPLSLDSSCEVALPDLTGEVVATDNCGTPVITQAPVAGTMISANTLVTLTATDGASLTDTCEVTVTVQDTTPPEITTCASDPGPLSLDSSCEVALPDLTGDVVATDNCGTSAITQAPVAGTMISEDTLVTLTATDGSGLTDTCAVTVTVQDTTPPEITVCASNPGPLSLDSSCEVALPDLTGGVEATDNCGEPAITQAPVAGTMISEDTLVTLTATDGEGLTDTCEVTVTVKDGLVLTSPNGGEEWFRGTKHAVTWESCGDVGSNVNLGVYRGETYLGPVIAQRAVNGGLRYWTVPSSAPLGSDYRVRVESSSAPDIHDESDAPFSIVAPLRVTAPNGGETWSVSTLYDVTWESHGDAPGPQVNVGLFRGKAFLGWIIAKRTANDGVQPWRPVWLPSGTHYKVRVQSSADPSVYDESDGEFTIEPAALAVAWPNGGEALVAGRSYPVQWESYGVAVGADVKVGLSVGATFYDWISRRTTNDGYGNWLVPSGMPLAPNYKLFMQSFAPGDPIRDYSNKDFAIVASADPLVVVSPNGGETWIRGMRFQIRWVSSSDDVGPQVDVELFKGAASVAQLGVPTANDGLGYAELPLEAPLGSDYWIRVRSSSNAGIGDVSDGTFTISDGR